MTVKQHEDHGEATRALKEIFFAEYGGFADKRIKNLDKGSVFIIDDRGPRDFGADRDLYLWFCMMFVEVIDDNTIRVSLHRNVPQGKKVSEWCAENCAQMTETSVTGDFSLTFEVKRGEQKKLSTLARAFRSIVEGGARYEVPSYKYVCPRITDALARLQEVLSRAWPTNGSESNPNPA